METYRRREGIVWTRGVLCSLDLFFSACVYRLLMGVRRFMISDTTFSFPFGCVISVHLACENAVAAGFRGRYIFLRKRFRFAVEKVIVPFSPGMPSK